MGPPSLNACSIIRSARRSAPPGVTGRGLRISGRSSPLGGVGWPTRCSQAHDGPTPTRARTASASPSPSTVPPPTWTGTRGRRLTARRWRTAGLGVATGAPSAASAGPARTRSTSASSDRPNRDNRRCQARGMGACAWAPAPRQVGELDHPAHRRRLLGHGRGPLVPGVQHLRPD